MFPKPSDLCLKALGFAQRSGLSEVLDFILSGLSTRLDDILEEEISTLGLIRGQEDQSAVNKVMTTIQIEI